MPRRNRFFTFRIWCALSQASDPDALTTEV